MVPAKFHFPERTSHTEEGRARNVPHQPLLGDTVIRFPVERVRRGPNHSL